MKTMNYNGDTYLIDIQDGTHCRFKIDAHWCKEWTISYHINQLSDGMLAAMRDAGIVSGRYFIESEANNV